jgi:hypothetical protein
MEGDLPDEERRLFEDYLANHSELQREYNLFNKTRLVADTSIKYIDKHKLYRKSGTTIIMNWVARAAAVVIVLWGITSLIQTEVQPPLSTSTHEIASVKTPSVFPDKRTETVISSQKTETVNKKPANKEINKPLIAFSKPLVNRLEQKPEEKAILHEREISHLEEIPPMIAQLEVSQLDNRLAISHSINTEKINDPRNIMSVDEFLASRAKKVGNEGLLSLQRIFRTGLTVASELSGDRIGYNVKNGKISSIGYESKLMAFSIPLKKN